ncbi:MAG: hypothetical protein GXN99_00120 [Candidatus Nanohaloarchaeota archaeon]|nr:hypothetical protein [Candidatus Nanohaloarchaeota archaeon]
MQGISIAISGGGTRGYAALPIFERVVNTANIKNVAGTSIGSIIAAYYCIHGSVRSLKDKKAKYMHFFSLNPKISLWDANKVKKFLTEDLDLNYDFKECSVPLYINATDIKTLKPVVFSKGNIIDAIMASIALPPLLPAYVIGSRYYIDGGFSKPYLKADVIIDLLEGSLSNYSEQHNNVMNNAIIAFMALIKNTKSLYADSFVFSPFERDSNLLNVFDFRKSPAFYKKGEAYWKKKENEFLRWLDEKKRDS